MRNKKFCKNIKKDYQKKSLNNPFFRRNKEGKISSIFKFIIILIFVVLISLTWFFLSFSLWSIKNIKVNGLTRFDQEEVVNVIKENIKDSKLLLFKKDNIFLFAGDAKSLELQEKFGFANVKIKKQLPDTLVIEISEKPYAFTFEENGRLFYSSEDNYLIDEISLENESEDDKIEREKYFILKNKSNTSLIDGNNKLKITKDYLNFISSLNTELKNREDLNFEAFIISDTYFRSLILQIKEGPQITFNVNNDLGEQLNQLFLVKNEKMKDNFNKLDYIDLRYGNTVFYYPKDIISN